MGPCCSIGRPIPARHSESCQGHHSVYVHPEPALSHTNFNVVYRPPQLNQRLAPGSARPRFWLSPTPELQGPAVVSVAWCDKCPPRGTCRAGPNGPNQSRRCFKRSSAIVCVTPAVATSPHKPSPGLGVPEETVQKPGGTVQDARMAGDSDCLLVKAYPAFLTPFVNQVVRLRLVFTDPKVEKLVGEYSHLKHNEEEQEPMLETSYLVRSLHSIRLQLGYSNTIPGLPEVTLEENHGGVKRRKKVRYRPMPVRWIDLDHRTPSMTVVGEAFQLTLARPCPALTSEDFPDGNGETPEALGTYIRSLDSCPERKLQFSARLYQWFNQAAPVKSLSDASSKMPFLEDSILDL